MQNSKVKLIGLPILLAMLGICLLWQVPTIEAHFSGTVGSQQSQSPTPTPRPTSSTSTTVSRTVGSYSSQLLYNSLHSAGLGGPGGGGDQFHTKWDEEPCITEQLLGGEDNLWAINQTTFILDGSQGMGPASPLYPRIVVIPCSEEIDPDKMVVTLTPPRGSTFILPLVPVIEDLYGSAPEIQELAFAYTFPYFSDSGDYLLTIRNGNREQLSQQVKVAKARDVYDGIRFLVSDPDSGEPVAWVQRGQQLKVTYTIPEDEETVQVALYPPKIIGGDWSNSPFAPFDLAAGDLWSVKSQEKIVEEHLYFVDDGRMGTYALMAGELITETESRYLDRVEPMLVPGNLIAVIEFDYGSGLETLVQTEYLYHLAVLDTIPEKVTLNQQVPVTYTDVSGYSPPDEVWSEDDLGKYTAINLFVTDTMVISSTIRPGLILNSYGEIVGSGGWPIWDHTWILPGSDTYLIISWIKDATEFPGFWKLEHFSLTDYVDLLLTEGKEAFRKGEGDQAISLWEEAATIQPELGRAFNLLCWGKSMQGGWWLPYLHECNRAITQGRFDNDRRLPLYHDSRGVAHALAGNLDAAADDFAIYLEAYPNNRRRRQWVTDLRAGINPFLTADGKVNEALLEMLRKEPI